MPSEDLKIRVPRDIKEWLRERAVANCRTMNGEILALLKATKQVERTTKKETA